MSIEASMAGYYAERAAEYDRLYHKPERQSDLRELRSLVQSTFTRASVFEAACGTGYWTEIVARSAASVLATDINEEVLSIARSRLSEVSTVTFRRADAYNLPTTLERYDSGLSAFWWSHVPKARLRSFLEGFHRVLKPGARVVFIDNNYVEGSSTPLSRADEHGNTYQTRSLDDGSRHEVLKNFPTGSELRAAIEGMTSEVEVRSLQYYWVLSYVLTLPRQPG